MTALACCARSEQNAPDRKAESSLGMGLWFRTPVGFSCVEPLLARISMGGAERGFESRRSRCRSSPITTPTLPSSSAMSYERAGEEEPVYLALEDTSWSSTG